MPGSKEKGERNRDILEMRRAGSTYQAIAYEFNISHQRARYIVKRWQRRQRQ